MPSKKNEYAAKWFRKKYPNLADPLRSRHHLYNDTVAFCEQLEAENKAILLRPSAPIQSFEKDIDNLRAAYQDGYEQAMQKIKQIQDLFT